MPSHPNTRSLVTASCHHPERIFGKIIESWTLQICGNSPLENVTTSLYRNLSVALNFLFILLSHALGQHSVTRTKNFLSRARPAPSPTRTRPANAGTRKRGKPAPRTTLFWIQRIYYGSETTMIVACQQERNEVGAKGVQFFERRKVPAMSQVLCSI